MSKRRRQRKAQSQTAEAPPPVSIVPAQTKENFRSRAVWVGGVLSLTALAGIALLWSQFRSVSPAPVALPQADLVGPAAAANTNIAAPAEGLTSETTTNIAVAPANSSKDSSSVDLNQQANKQMESGDLAGAIQLYLKALSLTPDDEDLHYNLGIAYVKAGDLDKAEQQYREALRLLPDYAEVHNNLGNLLLRLGRINEAEEQFNAAIGIMPEFAAAHNNLGIVRQRQKRLADATACFKTAVKCDTNYFEAHFNLASVYIIEHQQDNALAELHETLRINPGFEPAQRALARLTGQASPAALR